MHLIFALLSLLVAVALCDEKEGAVSGYEWDGFDSLIHSVQDFGKSRSEFKAVDISIRKSRKLLTTGPTVIVVQGKTEEAAGFDIVKWLMYFSASISATVVLVIVFHITGYKRMKCLSKKKGVVQVESGEEPHAGTALEDAGDGWEELTDGNWIHKNTLSHHTEGPDHHTIKKIDVGRETTAVECPKKCVSVGNRPYGSKVYLYVAVFSCLLAGGSAFSFAEKQTVLVEVGLNHNIYELKKNLTFESLPPAPQWKEVKISFCRGVGIRTNLSSCDNSTRTGIHSVMVLGCDSNLYYDLLNSGWTTRKGHSTHGVCGTMTVWTESGVSYEVDNSVIKALAYKVVEVHPAYRKRRKRALKVGSTNFMCFGGGGGFGFVAVTTYCDIGGILAPYTTAINDLFSSSIKTVTLLGNFINDTATTLDGVFDVQAYHAERLTDLDDNAAYSTVYTMVNVANLRFMTEFNKQVMNYRRYVNDRKEKFKIENELLHLTTGKRDGHVISEMSRLVYEKNKDLDPQITLRTDLCDIEAEFLSNENGIQFQVRMLCPDTITVAQAVVEIYPEYCVMVEERCRCQDFHMNIYHNSQVARVTNPALANSLLWPFSRKARSARLTWRPSTPPPQLAVSIEDHTRSSIIGKCPSVFSASGSYGAITHCGGTCRVESTSTSLTNAIVYSDRNEPENIFFSGGTLRLPKRINKTETVILRKGMTTLITTDSSNEYVEGPDAYELQKYSSAQTDEAGSQVEAIRGLQKDFADSAISHLAETTSIRRELETNQAKFNDALASSSTKGIAISSVAIVLSVAAIVVSIVSLVYMCIQKKAVGMMEKGNRGAENRFYVCPGDLKWKDIMIGCILTDGTWLDCESDVIRAYFIKASCFCCCRYILCKAILIKGNRPRPIVPGNITFRSGDGGLDLEKPNSGAIGGKGAKFGGLVPDGKFKRKTCSETLHVDGNPPVTFERKGSLWWWGDFKISEDDADKIRQNYGARVTSHNPLTIKAGKFYILAGDSAAY